MNQYSWNLILKISISEKYCIHLRSLQKKGERMRSALWRARPQSDVTRISSFHLNWDRRIHLTASVTGICTFNVKMRGKWTRCFSQLHSNTVLMQHTYMSETNRYFQAKCKLKTLEKSSVIWKLGGGSIHSLMQDTLQFKINVNLRNSLKYGHSFIILT